VKRFAMRVFVLVFACLAGMAICRADELAAVTGLVTDANGRSVPGVTVLITNLSTNVVSRTVTNDQGIYRVPSLQPGIYRITVDKDGFKSIVKSGIELHIQDVASINFELQIGSVNETVTVEGGGLVINTTDAAVGTVIDRSFAENLPLNGRSFNTLLQLTPGVVIAPIPSNSVTSSGQFSIAGQRSDSNNFTVDGVSANFGATPQLALGQSGLGSSQAFSAVGGTSSLVSVDALQEFRVETSSFSPEFGRSPGGQVILTTRSGTNALHGGVFDYFRNDVMDANNWFSNQKGLPRAPERHNDFGGIFGGPVWRDKTFFFFSYEGARLRLPNTLVDEVPTPAARASAPPALAPYLDLFELPNGPVVPGDPLIAQYTGAFSNQATLNATSLRIDHYFNSRFSIFARYNYAPSELLTRGAFMSPNTVLATTANVQTATVGLDMLLSGGISNTIRGNYSTQASYNVYSIDSFGGAIVPSPSVLYSNLPTAATWVTFTFDDTLSEPTTGPNAKNRTKQFNVTDALAKQVGQHSLKFGGDFRELYLNGKVNRYQVEIFPGTVQNFLASGTANSVPTLTFNPGRIRTDALSLFAQDSWKLRRRLTLTYGLRWELDPAPTALSGTNLAAWTNVNNPATIAVAPPGTALWSTTYTNFGPRIGAAYALTDAGDFVLRAGWGIFYDLGSGVASTVIGSWPNQSLMRNSNVPLPVPDMTPYLPPPHTLQPPYGSPGALIFAFSPDLKLPRSYQWNVALEKSFGAHQAISATYVGQSGDDLLRLDVTGRPNANFAPATVFELTNNSAASNYQALQVQYRRPLTSRLQALLNYSWSHSIDNASADTVAFLSGTAVPLSAQLDRGNSDFDVRHSFSGAFTYELPSPRKLGPFSYVARDWSLDGVVVARSGFPFTAVLQSGSPIGRITRRANLISGQPLWVPDASAPGGKMINANAFSTPPAGTQGNEGRNIIPGFGFTQVDLSLGRRFPINERVNLRFRADAFNVLNHPNFTNPIAQLQAAPTLLQSTKMLNQGLGGLNPLFQEGGPRSLQLSLKLTF
jgi:hypothetical protein